ncbi:hypothetical protein CE489_02540 [Bacillus spizizenii]|nr:hypothetical protein CE489_02540 [Bacillus spizizenii]
MPSSSIKWVELSDFTIFIDGCGVPVHGIPLYNAALGYAKLACPDGLKPELKNSCERVFSAMNNAPEMVAGTGGFCTELIKKTNGKLIGKLGSDGVYCVAIKGFDIGIAIKIEDGNYTRAIAPIVIRCLEDLGVLNPSETKNLRSFKSMNITNASNSEVNAAFHLDEAVH